MLGIIVTDEGVIHACLSPSIDFVRRYDSLTGDVGGSFGNGWRLALRDVDYATDVPSSILPLRIDSRVYLTLPDGERGGFTFAPILHEGQGFKWYEPRWIADPGIDWQLASINSAAENVTVGSLVVSSNGTWIGLNDRSTEGSFVWQNADPVTYTNWISDPGGGSSFTAAAAIAVAPSATLFDIFMESPGKP